MENRKPKGQEKNTEEMIVHIAELQAKAVELKEGLTGAMEDLSTLQQKGICLEERIVTYQNEMDGKILDIRNCLSSFEEDLGATLSHVNEINSKQREMQRDLAVFRSQMTDTVLSNQLSKGTEEDCSEDDRKCFSSQTVSSIIQNLPDSLPQLSTVSTQTSVSENDFGCPREALLTLPVWTVGKNNVERKNIHKLENQSAAMELLESERVYVSYLSLLLNANIAFNGNEAIHIKDKRPFPSSLRFLIQQHLKLLHTLQERVLKCQWQGIIGDVFLRLTNKESDFLDHYVTYLKELPKCLSAINMYSSSSMETAGLFEDNTSGAHPSFYTLLLQPVQRIPEYLLLLQNLLKQTDAEHPDYYALLISIEQLKAFTSHFSPVLQYSKELLLGGRMEVRRQDTSQSMSSKQRQMKMQPRCLEDWVAESPQHGVQAPPFLTPSEESKNNSAMERSPQDTQEPCRTPSQLMPFKLLASSSTLEEIADEFLLAGVEPCQESLCDDEDSAHSILNLDDCSTTSSDSSIDIAFLYWHGDCTQEPCGRGQSQLPMPADTSLEKHHPLQAVQRMSRSLNGLQLDSSPVESRGYKGLSPRGLLHAKVERQYSAGSPGCKVEITASPLRRSGPESSTGRVEMWREQSKLVSPCSTYSSQDQPVLTSPRVNIQAQEEQSGTAELKYKKSEADSSPVSFSQRSRKQEQKGGFRSSFKKLFKKKSSGDKNKVKEDVESALMSL